MISQMRILPHIVQNQISKISNIISNRSNRLIEGLFVTVYYLFIPSFALPYKVLILLVQLTSNISDEGITSYYAELNIEHK